MYLCICTYIYIYSYIYIQEDAGGISRPLFLLAPGRPRGRRGASFNPDLLHTYWSAFFLCNWCQKRGSLRVSFLVCATAAVRPPRCLRHAISVLSSENFSNLLACTTAAVRPPRCRGVCAINVLPSELWRPRGRLRSGVIARRARCRVHPSQRSTLASGRLTTGLATIYVCFRKIDEGTRNDLRSFVSI